MDWVRRIMLWVGVLLIVAIAAAYMLPRNVRVERSATIGAPQATLFTLLNSFKQFNKWSPWFELDPGAKYTHEGPGAGVGAKLSWVGTRGPSGRAVRPSRQASPTRDRGRRGLRAGRRPRQTGLHARPRRDRHEAHLEHGRRSRNEPDCPLLRPGIRGHDRRDFDKGLALLKKFAEGLPTADFAGLQIEAVSVEPVPVAFVPASSPRHDGALAVAIAKAYDGNWASSWRRTP